MQYRFLYFYILIWGSVSTSGMNAERVIVFEDPVSSLDSDVLFIVRAIIKRVLEAARWADRLIKQVFVLTHKIYFHKEVSFDPKRGLECRAYETFWIVRKVNDRSVISGYNHNPISTSYELLWNVVRCSHGSMMGRTASTTTCIFRRMTGLRLVTWTSSVGSSKRRVIRHTMT